jgi:hypothetical protein
MVLRKGKWALRVRRCKRVCFLPATAEELQQISKHLQYEVNMLLAVANGLASGIVTGSNAHNALAESFAAHLRNLIDFFWPQKPKNDHVIARDFFPSLEYWEKQGPAIPKELREARLQTAKEIAHLTYERLTRAQKGWAFRPLTDEIMKTYRLFLDEIQKRQLATTFSTTSESEEGATSNQVS